MDLIPLTSHQENPSFDFTFAPPSRISTLFFLSKAFFSLTLVPALFLSLPLKSFVKMCEWVYDLICHKNSVYRGSTQMGSTLVVLNGHKVLLINSSSYYSLNRQNNE